MFSNDGNPPQAGKKSPQAGSLGRQHQQLLTYIYLDAPQEVWISLWHIEAIVGSERPVIPRLLHGMNYIVSNMLQLPNRIGKSTHWMAQSLLQHYTTVSYFILRLGRVG